MSRCGVGPRINVANPTQQRLDRVDIPPTDDDRSSCTVDWYNLYTAFINDRCMLSRNCRYFSLLKKLDEKTTAVSRGQICNLTVLQLLMPNFFNFLSPPQAINSDMRHLPRTHNTYGDKSFTAAGLSAWNSLPSYLRRDISYQLFKWKLKTFLFGHWLTLMHCDCFLFLCATERFLLNYLLTYSNTVDSTR